MLKKVCVRLGFVLPALLFLAAADTITLANATPNPGGNANQVGMDGTFGVDPANNFSRLDILAKETTRNETTFGQPKNVDLTKGTFDGTLGVAPGTYDCWARLYTVNTTKKTASLLDSNKINAVVK